MKPKVEITAIDGVTFRVNLINTLSQTVKSYIYYNYIDNGDGLARTCNEWVTFGFFPNNVKGLIEDK